MLAMTSLQSLVVLLSAVQHVQLSSFIFTHPVMPPADKLFKGESRVPPIDSCKDHDEIARWINEQVLRNAKLTRFNQRIGQALDSLSSNGSTQILEEHCCFYEKNTMDRIFTDIQSLSTKNQIKDVALTSSGDIGKDLDAILKRMKTIVGQDLNNCCKQLSNNLKKLELDTIKQLEDLANKLNANNNSDKAEREQLQQKQQELEKQQKELAEQIDQLQKKLKEYEAKPNDDTCCQKLTEKLTELAKVVESAKTETQNKTDKLENELQAMQEKQAKLETGLAGIKEELAKGVNNLQAVNTMCEEKCNLFEKHNKDNITDVDHFGNHHEIISNPSILNRLEHLEQAIKELDRKTEKILNLNVNIAGNDQIVERIRIINEKLQKLTKLYEEIVASSKNTNHNENNCCACQDNNIDNNSSHVNNNNNNDNNNIQLPQSIQIARNCCENIDNLTESNKELRKDIENKQKEQDQKILELNADIKKVQDRLDAFAEREEKEKLQASHTTDSIKQLQEDLTKINTILPMNVEKLKNNDNKLKEIEENCNKEYQELTELIEKQANENKLNTNSNIIENGKDKQKVEQEHILNDELVKILESLGFLKGRYKELNDDVNKVKQLEQRIDNLEQKVDNALNKLAESVSQISECFEQCKKLDGIDDLIDRIEDLEQVVVPTTKKPHLPPSKGLGIYNHNNNNKNNNNNYNNKELKKNISLIGSSDSYKVHIG